MGLENQLPVLEAPDGLVLVTDEAKKFYERVVSQRPDMRDLHGTSKTPHQALRKLMAGTPRRKHEWRVYTPTQVEVFAWLRRVNLQPAVTYASWLEPSC